MPVAAQAPAPSPDRGARSRIRSKVPAGGRGGNETPERLTYVTVAAGAPSARRTAISPVSGPIVEPGQSGLSSGPCARPVSAESEALRPVSLSPTKFPGPRDSDQHRRDQGVAHYLHGRAEARVGEHGNAADQLGAEDQQEQHDQPQLLPLLALRGLAGQDRPDPAAVNKIPMTPSTTAGYPGLVPGTRLNSETAIALVNASKAAAARTC